MGYVLNERILEAPFVLEQVARHAARWRGDEYCVADVGAGPSRIPHLLANAGVTRVDAYDPLLPSEYSSERSALRVRFHRHVFEESESTLKYAAIISVSVLEHVAEPELVIEAMNQRLHDEGLVVITVPFSDPPRTIKRRSDMVYARPIEFWTNLVPQSWELRSRRLLSSWRWTRDKWERTAPHWHRKADRATVALFAWQVLRSRN